MNKVRERILREVESHYYVGFELHEDLIAFCVGDGYFGYNPETEQEEDGDFNGVTVVVEKDWLFDLIKKTEKLKTDEDVRIFLREEYTSDDSINWYNQAILEHKVVMVDFY